MLRALILFQNGSLPAKSAWATTMKMGGVNEQ